MIHVAAIDGYQEYIELRNWIKHESGVCCYRKQMLVTCKKKKNLFIEGAINLNKLCLRI